MKKAEALEKIKDICDEYSEKMNAISEDAKKRGIFIGGLDGNKELFAEVEKESNEKIKIILESID